MNPKIYEFLGIIPARGGSKGIPRKNIKNFCGKPLIEYTFDAVNDSKLLNRCIISTDDDEIINFSRKKQMEVPFKRPVNLATDTASGFDVIVHALNFLKNNENYIPEYVVILQPTSPLRIGQDIDNAIEIISNNQSADSLVSVFELPHRFSPNSIMRYNGEYLENYIKDIRIERRQDKPIFYAKSGAAIFISRYDLIMKEKKIIGEKCLPYFIPKERSVDIDDYYDWEIGEYFMRKKMKKHS